MSTSSGRSSPSRTSGTIRRRKQPTKLSEMVTRRAREAAALATSIRVHKTEVAAGLSDWLAPALRDGQAVPDHELTLALAGRSVQLAFDRLDELDDRHDFKKAERAHQAREADRLAKQELYPHAVAVRRQIDAAYGRKAGSHLHTFTGRIPRTPIRLKQHVERAVSRLGDPNRPRPPRLQAASEPVDHESFKRRLEGPLRHLARAEDNLSRLKAEVDAVAIDRDRAMRRFDAVYAEAFHLVEAAFKMAGLSDNIVKSLRSLRERRRLAHWARRKRQARANHQAPAPAPIRHAEPPPAEKLRRKSEGAVAAVSRWLKRSRVFG